jgi:hypothetical protein
VNVASVRLQTDALNGARGSQQLYLHQSDYESLVNKTSKEMTDAYGLSRARGLGGLGGVSMGISTSIGSVSFDAD